jgi:hypothetical protein
MSHLIISSAFPLSAAPCGDWRYELELYRRKTISDYGLRHVDGFSL